MFQSIGFIGTGNMGSALALAADKGAPQGAVLYLSNRTPAKAEALCAKLSRAQVSTNEEIARTCGLIFLGVKPQMMAGVLEGLRPILAARTDRFVVCSMAAGLTLDALEGMLGKEYPLIRILPNTPAAIGQGIAQFCVRGVTEEEKSAFLSLMAPSGLLDEMDEGLMAAANCVSGCGVAFAALFMEDGQYRLMPDSVCPKCVVFLTQAEWDAWPKPTKSTEVWDFATETWKDYRTLEQARTTADSYIRNAYGARRSAVMLSLIHI